MEEIPKDHEVDVNPSDQPPGSGVSLSLSEIEVLRDRIEQQKANKLKAEQLVSTLSRIKAREKATRRSTKGGEKKIDDGTSTQPTKRSGTNSSNALKEKSNLLKKKLEEDRAKFESKKGQEDLGRVSQIVEHIRVQLEDQDKTIQQIHSNFSTNKAPQPDEEVVPEEPDIPPEVKQRISDLEMKILDLQENLREKDSVISARTQAITLLSEDMARKGKNTLDTLEETRSQMKTMQANFVLLEDRMNEERSRLKTELEAKKQRIQQLEKNYRAAESARFDLSTRVAELQEKIVSLQTKNLALEEEVSEVSGKTKEFKEALENSNKQTIKMKAQFKAKLKAIEEERDMLRQEERTNEELNRLRERIADLEDEKEAGTILKERIAEMEEKLQRQECDLDSHIKMITSLEAEKLDLLDAVGKKNVVLKEKEEMFKLLETQMARIEETKISAEMKCLELEEKLDTFIKKENDDTAWEDELGIAKQKLIDYQGTINDLTLKLERKESILNTINNQAFNLDEISQSKNLQDVSSDLQEWQNRYSLLEEKLNATLTYCEELEDNKKIIEIENERLLNDCGNLKDAIDNLNSIFSTKSESSDQELITFKQTVAQKEMEISNLNKEKKTLETEIDSLRYSLQSTTAEVHRLSQQIEELHHTQQKVEELSVTLDSKDKELQHVSTELNERSRKLSEYKKFHKLKSEDVLKISHELETVTASYQKRIQELEVSLSNALKSEEDLRIEIKDLKERGNSGTGSVDTKLQEQSLKMKKLAANVKLKTKLVKDLEAKVEELEKALEQKNMYSCNLEHSMMDLQKQFVESDKHENENHPNEFKEKCNVLETEVNSLREELKSKTDELEYLKSSLNTKHETLVQIKELENQNQKLIDISETKSGQLRKMEDEISDLSGLNKSLLSELEQMQESYKQDALKNESVLDSFEHEMLGNKNDILELGNQLKEVTSKYEQTWAKLQEKEGYIEDLEQQLEKVKVRLLTIESTVEDRRRSLEEKAELLGSRLFLAEKNNEEMEKHEGELEQKIDYLLKTEEMLSNVLEKLKEENNEISKSLSESADKNIHLSQDLDNERQKVKNLTKEINNMQATALHFEKMSEDYEIIKKQLKESQEIHESKTKYLESRLVESEQCMESEIRRLSDKISLVEMERQEIIEKCNFLFVEKQALEEEMGNLQQTIADLSREDMESLKNNHQNLAEQLSIELEKRQANMERIQELESQITKLSMNSQSCPTLNSGEVFDLKQQLEKEIKEKERLTYELLKEKAKKQIDDVVSKAEETYFTMSVPGKKVEKEISASVSLESGVVGDSLDPILFRGFDDNQSKHVDDIKELKNKVASLISENAHLKSHLQELESCGQNISESTCAIPEIDDWAAVSKDEDDGWGWGSKDAMLEHEYLQKHKINSELEAKVMELEKRLLDLDEENKRLSEELKASQSKCSKLLKKVKEFKIKSDSLERNSREKSVGFDDLDLAIQEELRAQVEKLEKSLKECNTNLNALQIEREGFLKRIDTLISGNERLVEMKERQDIEVEMWQKRSSELQNKVQGLEWTIAELHDEQDESRDVGKSTNVFLLEEKQQFLCNALEMEEKLNVLAAENEYLQSVIVELKEKDKKSTGSLSTVSTIDEEKLVKQENSTDPQYLQLQEENVKLSCIIQTLEKKLEVENKTSNDDELEYSHRIESLMKENEWLSSTIEKMKAKEGIELDSHEDFRSLKEKMNVLKSENGFLSTEVSELNDKLTELRNKYDSVQTERNNFNEIIEKFKDQNIKLDVHTTLPENEKSDEDAIKPSSNADESPTLFRGFTSLNDDSFEVPSKKFNKSTLDTSLSGETSFVDQNIPFSVSQVDFFDTIKIGPVCEAKFEEGDQQLQKISQPCSERSEVNEKSIAKDFLLESSELQTLLSAKDSELNSLKQNLVKLEEENNKLKRQIEEDSVRKTFDGTWDPLPDRSSNEYCTDNNLQVGAELHLINKKLKEKDDIINVLQDKLNSRTGDPFYDESNKFLELTSVDSFSDLFSQSERNNESQINELVEQITELTKTAHDKEVEIQLLTDKKRKYKEMYHALAKECDVQSSDISNSDKEQLNNQNIMLNQLLDDKETELEIMNQQIEQTIVGKDNLQDELSLKLSEMEATNKSFDNPEIQKEMLFSSPEPKNIEEVKTLCAEVEELTKLLQEKESEVEILKQQLDESRLERENLIDEWEKKCEEYKNKSNIDLAKAEAIEKELKTYKDNAFSDIDKQYKDEIFLKEQQLMNAMNDLHNTNSFCQDIQAKLNNLEYDLGTCRSQNNVLVAELNDVKSNLNDIDLIIQEVGLTSGLSLIDKVKQLKDDFIQIEVNFNQAKVEIEEKDSIIFALKEKVKALESNSGIDEKVINEQPLSSSQMIKYASEPFRISTEQSSSDDDSSSRNMETIQGQMMLLKEIQSLKQVLSMKDAEITKMSIALNEAQENLIRGEMRFINSEEESLRHRLDEALYTLHLRDVRCDELALELMQLLEERDSLQLRLSTAIRFNEELRENSKAFDEAVLKIEGEANSPPKDENNGKREQLKQKLDQLHIVGYRRDPALQQDQQKRHHEQMHLYTQQTTQDESQQPSGFFNWIFGASSSGSQDV